MLHLILLAGSIAADGACSRHFADENTGEWVTCRLVDMPAVATMLNQHTDWRVTVKNPKRCAQPFNVSLQLAAGSAAVVELLERIEKSGAISAKLDIPNHKATITCNY